MAKGPLGFPRITDVGPFVESGIRPVHDLEAGVYPFSELEKRQDKTAEDTERFLREKLGGKAEFKYGEFSFEEIVAPNGFIPTLARYVGEEPEEIEDMIMRDTFPEDDLDALYAIPNDDIKFIADKVSNDVRRVNDIKEQIESRGEYFPPTFERKSSTLDGAHRTAALWHIVGPDNKIYAWELINAEEIGVE